MHKKKRRSSFRKMYHFLPKWYRKKLIRNKFNVSDSPSNLKFRIARTKEDLERAYEILYDTYVKMGYSEPSERKLRLTKYFTMPSTTTLVAIWDEKIIGTVSIIRRTPMRLPLEAAFDLSELVESGEELIEISSLAIDLKFDRSRGQVFFPFCRYLYRYIRFYLKAENVVIGVHPETQDFYEAVLGFVPLDKKILENYEFANGAPVVCLTLKVQTVHMDFWLNLNDQRKKHFPLFKYFVERECFEEKWPDRLYRKVYDPVMSPEMLEYFFGGENGLISNLSLSERVSLASFYPSEMYGSILPQFENAKRETRYLVNFKAVLSLEKSCSIFVRNVSKTGLRIRSSRTLNIEVGLKVNVEVFVSETKSSQIEGSISWVSESKLVFGVHVLNQDKIWKDMIRHFENEFLYLLNSNNSKCA